MYGDNAIGESAVRWWFGRFRTGNFNLEDEHRSGRPSKLDNDVLETKVKERLDITTRELAEELDISKSTVHEHLVSLGYTSRYNVWVPHKLSEKNCLDRYSICDMLLKRNESMPFLKTLVTEDEKWIFYDNVMRKRSWCLRNESPKQQPKDIHVKKVMLCVWCDFKGIIYYEILPQNQTINSMYTVDSCQIWLKKLRD